MTKRYVHHAYFTANHNVSDIKKLLTKIRTIDYIHSAHATDEIRKENNAVSGFMIKEIMGHAVLDNLADTQKLKKELLNVNSSITNISVHPDTCPELVESNLKKIMNYAGFVVGIVGGIIGIVTFVYPKING